MENENDITKATLLKMYRVIETSNAAEADELLKLGAMLLGVAKQSDDGSEYFMYSIGCPKSLKNLPDWVR